MLSYLIKSWFPIFKCLGGELNLCKILHFSRCHYQLALQICNWIKSFRNSPSYKQKNKSSNSSKLSQTKYHKFNNTRQNYRPRQLLKYKSVSSSPSTLRRTTNWKRDYWMSTKNCVTQKNSQMINHKYIRELRVDSPNKLSKLRFKTLYQPKANCKNKEVEFLIKMK